MPVTVPWADDVAPVAITVVTLYLTTFALVRIAGRRTVSELSAFDALVTIALGSLLAGSVLADPPSYRRGAVAIGTLLVVQVAVGAVRQRVPWLRRLLDFSPAVVARDGEAALDASPFGPQLTRADLDAVLRRRGVGNLGDVALIVLESDGTFSVVARSADDQGPFPDAGRSRTK